MKTTNLWQNAIVEQKERGKPWTAQTLAELLDGEWVNPPTEPDWEAAYFLRAGAMDVISSAHHPVSIMLRKDATPHYRAKAIIVNDPEGNFVSSKPYLKVKGDLSEAELLLAQHGRNVMNGKVIAIAGSVGKTTVTNTLADLLKIHGVVRHNILSRNTLFATRTILASCVTDPDYAVIEISEQAMLDKNNRTFELVKPDIAIITHVCLSHADEIGIDSVEGMALLISRISEGMKPGGICLLNREMECFELVRNAVASYGAKPVSYGLSQNADVWITDMSERTEKDGINVSVNMYGQEFSYHLGAYGTGAAINALGALTAMHYLGFNAAESSQYIGYLKRVRSRIDIRDVEVEGGTAQIVDDCFNAQPISYTEIISMMKNWTSSYHSRKIGIFGDIAVFGDPKFTHEYSKLINPIRDAGFDKVYFVGKDISKNVAGELPLELVGGTFNTKEEGLEPIATAIQANDVVFAKVTSSGIVNNNIALKLIDFLKKSNSKKNETGTKISRSHHLPACVAYSFDSKQRIAQCGYPSMIANEGLGHILILRLLLSLIHQHNGIHLSESVSVHEGSRRLQNEDNALGMATDKTVNLKTLTDAYVVANAPDAIISIVHYIYPKMNLQRSVHFEEIISQLSLDKNAVAGLTGRFSPTFNQCFTIDDLEKVAAYFFSLPLDALKPLKSTAATHNGKTVTTDSVLHSVPGIISYYCFGSPARGAIALANVKSKNVVICVCGAESAYERDVSICSMLNELEHPNENIPDEWIELAESRGYSCITMAGDTYFGEWHTRDRLRLEKVDALQKYGYQYSFEKIAHLLPKEDYNIVNFEGILTEERVDPTAPHFNAILDASPKETLDELKRRNIHAVMLGNNHALDFGEFAGKKSKNLFREHGFKTIGFGENIYDARKPLCFSGAGRRMIIFSADWYRRINHYSCRSYSIGNNAGVACLDDTTLQIISQYREKYPDAFIIISPHWGVDFAETVPLQRHLAKALIDAGVDCIIGHGTHMISDCEWIGEKFVLYSMGNFVFNSTGDGLKNKAPFGYVTKLLIEKDSLRVRLYPIATYNPDTFWQPHPVTDEQFDKVLNYYPVPDKAVIVRNEADKYLEFILLDK